MLDYNSEMPDVSGIYAIVNNINGKKYVGQSRYLPTRAILLDHENNTHLMNAYSKYGIDNFSVILLETCSVDLLDEREIY